MTKTLGIMQKNWYNVPNNKSAGAVLEAPPRHDKGAVTPMSQHSTPNSSELYRARIGKHGKSINLGYFPDAETAARAFDVAARELYGEFARLNFPNEGEL